MDINDPERLPFEMDTTYDPKEKGNNLKIALIQKREEFSDSPLPRMYDIELSQHNNSHSEVVDKFKVINALADSNSLYFLASMSFYL